jgi:EpsG family
MWPYGVLLLLPAMFAWSGVRLPPIADPWVRWRTPWWGMYVLLVLMVGLRHEVGGDWLTYIDHIDTVKDMPFFEALTVGDSAYSLLNWLATHAGGGVYFVNTVCAGLFAWGLVVYCRSMPMPWLALVVAAPYLVMVVAMGYTRQGVAIGMAMLGLVALSGGRVLSFAMWIAVAAFFHKSAVILIPLAIFYSTVRSWFRWVILAGASLLLFALLYWLLLQDSVENLRSGYLEAEYQSSGALIRVVMNALPAAIFLIFRNRFDLPPEQRKFWIWMSLGALGFLVMLVVSPSSTAVDRMALYWIPLQLFVWSHLPGALGQRGRASQLWVQYIVLYSVAVQLVWLFFAQTAFAWLPYQFYPWVVLFT